tara:strand:- start:22075 stop:22773 length:699 start_codon:yes stop_codon:yes gene_type:complete
MAFHADRLGPECIPQEKFTRYQITAAHTQANDGGRMSMRTLFWSKSPRTFLSMLLAALFLLSACKTEPANQGFCGIIPKRLEAAMSYGTSLYLGSMPDQEFLREDQGRSLRQIPPLEVREDPMAVQAVTRGRCAFSIFEESFASEQKELQGLKSAQLLYGYPDSVVFRMYVNPAALRGEEARTRTLDFLDTLWSDEFQSKLEFYGLKPVPEGLRTQVRNDLPGFLTTASESE